MTVQLGQAKGRPELVVVTPDLFERGGGIARIARATVYAAALHCAASGARLTVMSLNDGGAVRDQRYLPREATFLGLAGSRLRLARAVLSRAWSRAHAGTIFCHPNLSVLGLLFPGRSRFTIVAHGMDVWEPLSLPKRMALRHAAEIWPVSHYTGSVVRRLRGGDPTTTRVIQNCLDPFWAISCTPAPVPSARFALAVSRLGKGDRYKGIDVAINGFASLPAKHDSVEFWVVGDGDDRARLEAVAASTVAAGRVRFLGQVSDEQLQQLYATCAFFVLPSSKEGFGLVYLEAMAAGRAVIAASATAVPEVVLDGVTGRLLGPSDKLGIAAAMSALFGDPGLAARYGEAGRARVATNFSFDRYNREVSAGLARVFGVGEVT